MTMLPPSRNVDKHLQTSSKCHAQWQRPFFVKRRDIHDTHGRCSAMLLLMMMMKKKMMIIIITTQSSGVPLLKIKCISGCMFVHCSTRQRLTFSKQVVGRQRAAIIPRLAMQGGSLWKRCFLPCPILDVLGSEKIQAREKPDA